MVTSTLIARLPAVARMQGVAAKAEAERQDKAGKLE
jgi:hypothetical protein